MERGFQADAVIPRSRAASSRAAPSQRLTQSAPRQSRGRSPHAHAEPEPRRPRSTERPGRGWVLGSPRPAPPRTPGPAAVSAGDPSARPRRHAAARRPQTLPGAACGPAGPRAHANSGDASASQPAGAGTGARRAGQGRGAAPSPSRLPRSRGSARAPEPSLRDASGSCRVLGSCGSGAGRPRGLCPPRRGELVRPARRLAWTPPGGAYGRAGRGARAGLGSPRPGLGPDPRAANFPGAAPRRPRGVCSRPARVREVGRRRRCGTWRPAELGVAAGRVQGSAD